MSTSSTPTDSISPPNASQLDSQSYRQVSWRFWLKWTIATAVGWSLGVVLYTIFVFAIIQILNQALVGILLASLGVLIGGSFGGLIAASFGFAQGLLLRQYRLFDSPVHACEFLGWAYWR